MRGTGRVAEFIFRRDMLGPSFGHLAATVCGLLLLETISMKYILPAWVPVLEQLEATLGRLPSSLLLGITNAAVPFWGIGSLFALPAVLHCERWKIQMKRSLDLEALKRSLPLVAFNFIVGTTLASLVLWALLPEQSWNWHQLPGPMTLARDVVVWLLAEEVTFFYVHRWLHDKRMYAAVHKLHHTWTAPVSLVAIYCHPFEHVVSNVFPVVLGPLLCHSHVAAIGVWTFAGLIHTTAVHSGYWFCDDNGMHDEHHAKFNVNFGVMGLMDSWYGTYQLPGASRGTKECAEMEAKSLSFNPESTSSHPRAD